MYAVWPLSLENPESPIQTSGVLPLVTNSARSAGAYDSARNFTRPVVNASADLSLEPSQYQTFVTFWRDTLFSGKKLFTAPWISIAGYDGYAARLISYSSSAIGILPKVTLKLQFIPDVILDGTQTFPEIWPPLP